MKSTVFRTSCAPRAFYSPDVCRPDLVEPDCAEVVFQSASELSSLANGARLLCPLSGLDSGKVSVGIVGKARRASGAWAGCRHCAAFAAGSIPRWLGRRSPPDCPRCLPRGTRRARFSVGAEMLNAELRVEPHSALPESAHRLLAPVEDFCERRRVGTNLCADVCAAFAAALPCAAFHGINSTKW